MLLKYKSNSLWGYFPIKEKRDFVRYKTILDYMGGNNPKWRHDYRQFIKWGIDREMENPLEIGKGNGVVGEPDFVQWIKERFLNSVFHKYYYNG